MKTTANDITINYLKEGVGKPLLLLHGNGEDHTTFDQLIGLLKNHFTVYAIDTRNHGESSKTNDYTYQTMAVDLLGFIRTLNLNQVSVIGFSDGAITSLMLALQHPQVFEKMALLGINLKPTDFKPQAYDWLVAEYQKTHDPLLKMMLEQPQIELQELRNVQIPCLVVAAEDDLFPAETFERIAHALPHAQLLIMKGHDHASYVVNSDVLATDLIEFFG